MLALLAGLIVPGLDDRLNVVHYVIDAEEITVPVRIALVTDLHSCAYGEGQRELIDAVDAENPDIVLLGGDIFDDKLPDDKAKAFLAGIADRYPCWVRRGTTNTGREKGDLRDRWTSWTSWTLRVSAGRPYCMRRMDSASPSAAWMIPCSGTALKKSIKSRFRTLPVRRALLYCLPTGRNTRHSRREWVSLWCWQAMRTAAIRN